MIKVFLLLGFLALFYVLAPSLVAVAVVRTTFAWTKSRWLSAWSGLLALPQTVNVLFLARPRAPGTGYYVLNTASVGLALAAAVVWGFAVIGANKQRPWLEPVVFFVVTIWLLLSVKNWIAH